MLTIRISRNHTRFNLEAITNLEYLHLEFMLLHLDLFLKTVGTVCSEEHKTFTKFFHGESDLLANCSVLLEVNYKIVKKKTKFEEKIPM